MKFKANKIALLIAGLSFSAMSMANSVTVAAIDAAKANNTLDQAWITGASAPSRTIYEGWVKGCTPGTNTIFTNAPYASTDTSANATPGSIGNWTAYACVRNSRVAVLYHTMEGGSLNAYTPHTASATLSRLKYVGTGNGCNTTPVAFVDSVNSANNATVYKSCTKLGNDLPTTGSIATVSTANKALIDADSNAPSMPIGGFSDVEASLFPPSIGGGDVSSKGVEADVGVGQAFGIAVSIPLYRAMQAAQGITETGTTNNDYNPDNAPNITSAQYVSLMAVGGANRLSILLPGNTNRLNVHRRVATSGTQASVNAFFLKNPCAGGVASALSPRGTQETTTLRVVEHSSSTNVKRNLTTASGGSAADNIKFAIGVMSLENDWRSEPSDALGYRYLKLDGVHPEAGDVSRGRLSSVRGAYKFHMEMKSFVRTAPALSTFEAGLIPQIVTDLSSPSAASCAELPRGLTLIPPNGTECIATVNGVRSSNQVSRTSNLGKNCQAPIEYLY